MDIQKARDLLNQAIAALADDVPANTIHVAAGANLQALHDRAPAGALIMLAPGSYTGPLVSTKRLTWTLDASLPTGRATPSSPQAVIRGASDALLNSATDAAFIGLTFASNDPQATIVTDTGVRTLLNRCLVLGDPTQGQHRGIAANGQGAVISSCFVDNCFLPKRDAQAISGWDGTAGLTIDNCYLAGGAETVLFGGADASSYDRVPKNITIRRSTLTKRREWYALGAQIKCAFELKAARDVTVQDCILEYAGIDGGSTGYIVLLTPRNQDGTAPFSSVERVTIERCLLRYGGGAINMLATDNIHPSGPLQDVTIHNCAITDLDPTDVWKGQGRIFLLSGGPHNITFDSVTASGKNLGATFYISSPPIGLTIRNVILPLSTYGVKIDAGGMGFNELAKFAPGTVIDQREPLTGSIGQPAG